MYDCGRSSKRLSQLLPRAPLMECAKKLGMAHGKVLPLKSPNAMSVLIDYCLYCHCVKGKTVVERFAEKNL